MLNKNVFKLLLYILLSLGVCSHQWRLSGGMGIFCSYEKYVFKVNEHYGQLPGNIVNAKRNYGQSGQLFCYLVQVTQKCTNDNLRIVTNLFCQK